MLKAVIIGNLGADAVVRHVNGHSAIGFSVAHNEKYKDAQGVAHEKTLWVNCTFWRTKETALTEFLKKGQMVFVEGVPSVETYTNREGISVADFKLRVTNIHLLGGRTDNTDQPAAAQPATKQTVPATAKGQRKTQPQTAGTPVEDMDVPDWIKDSDEATPE